MAQLTLVRHGQASFLAENYDRLSALGYEQSQLLGDYWARNGTSFDQVYFGPAERHVETGRTAGAFCALAEPIDIPELNEYQGIEVMRTFLPGLMESHEDIRELEAQFRAAESSIAAARVYDRLFQRITGMWIHGGLSSPDVEPWRDFCARVETGIRKIREQAGKSGRIVAFTSGGVIGATARLALDLSPQKTLELSWASRNASFSEFLFSRDRFSLSSFNLIPHLVKPEHVTYR